MSNVIAMQPKAEWQDICSTDDLVAYSGISARINGVQIALFYVPDAEPKVYALDNWCPAAGANVLARGIVGDINGELVVASPLYKEHFSLTTGRCLEADLQVRVWPATIHNGRVTINM